jgi:hypothetical protein
MLCAPNKKLSKIISAMRPMRSMHSVAAVAALDPSRGLKFFTQTAD